MGVGTRGVDDFPSFPNINKVFCAVQIPHTGRQTWSQWLNMTEKLTVSDIILHCHIDIWSKWLPFWKRGFAQETRNPQFPGNAGRWPISLTYVCVSIPKWESPTYSRLIFRLFCQSWNRLCSFQPGGVSCYNIIQQHGWHICPYM